MGQNIYWHNITKKVYNINCLSDISDSFEVGDIIKFTIRGNALIFDLYDDTEDEGEYNYVREKLLDQIRL